MLVEGITLNEIHSLIFICSLCCSTKNCTWSGLYLEMIFICSLCCSTNDVHILDCSVKSQVFLMARSPKISLIHCHILTLLSSLQCHCLQPSVITFIRPSDFKARPSGRGQFICLQQTTHCIAHFLCPAISAPTHSSSALLQLPV